MISEFTWQQGANARPRYSIPTSDGQSGQARIYHPVSAGQDHSLPVYIHFHGGGWHYGTFDSEDATCSRIAFNTGVIVRQRQLQTHT